MKPSAPREPRAAKRWARSWGSSRPRPKAAPTWVASARKSKPNWADSLRARPSIPGGGRSMTGRIPDSFLDELVSRSDIVDVISARVPLKKAGREYKACCPFHNEKSPSFSVSAEKQFYHCFGCGAHGTVIGFLMQYEKMEFLDAVAALAQRARLELPRQAQAEPGPGTADLHELMLRAARFFEQNLADNARAKGYVERRGIDAKTCAKFGLGYAPDAWEALLKRFGTQEDDRRRLLQAGLILERSGEKNSGFYDRFRDPLMFPIPDSRARVTAFGGHLTA